MMHSYKFTMADTAQALALGTAWPFVWGYALLAVLLWLGNWCRIDEGSHG